MSRVCVRVRVGAESYAVPIGSVLEITELGDIAPLPGAPAAVLGLRNLHGQVLPVLDLGAILGVAADDRPARIVVTEDGGRSAGLAVDAVSDVELLPAATEEVASAHLGSASLVDGALVGAIDVGAVLDTVEGQLR